jgi:hypothetical protein
MSLGIDPKVDLERSRVPTRSTHPRSRNMQITQLNDDT